MVDILYDVLTIEWSLLIAVKIGNTILFLKALLRSLFGEVIFMGSFGEISSVVFPGFNFFETAEMMLI